VLLTTDNLSRRPPSYIKNAAENIAKGSNPYFLARHTVMKMDIKIVTRANEIDEFLPPMVCSTRTASAHNAAKLGMRKPLLRLSRGVPLDGC
jgi:hypothetical protein